MIFEDYRAIPAINATAIKAGRVSMKHMHAVMTGKPKEPTAAMRTGTLIHTAVLEPARFSEKSHVWTDGAKKGKAYNEFKAEKDPFWILNGTESAKVEAIKEAVWSDPDAYRIIEGGEIEVTKQWDDLACGPCKARIDVVGKDYIADLKTTSQIEPDRFASQCAQLGYHLQMGFYARAVDPSPDKTIKVYIIAVETAPPYDVAVFELSPFAVKAGCDRALEIACEYCDCVQRGEFPGVSGGEVQELDLPSWADGMGDVPDLSDLPDFENE